MNKVDPTPTPSPTLSQLSGVQLSGFHLALWAFVQRACGGPAAGRHRMMAEAHDLLALAQISGRLFVHGLDLASGLCAQVELEVPVPCLRDPASPLCVAPRALLGLLYPQEALFLPQPGYTFVRILAPRSVWHSNVSADVNQILCLGPRLPAGIPLKEILLMTFGALSMQTTQLDAHDPAGVLNPAAAEWWQRNPHRIPLTREPFLRRR